jgi:hypothetical protein
MSKRKKSRNQNQTDGGFYYEFYLWQPGNLLAMLADSCAQP